MILNTKPIKLNISRRIYPLYSDKVEAGFPSPAEDYIANKLSLDELLVQHPASTYFVRASGDSMVDSGILPNDILIVDRSLNPKDGDIVIAESTGEFLVKIFRNLNGKIHLEASNSNKKFNLNKIAEFEIWGVVISVVHQLR